MPDMEVHPLDADLASPAVRAAARPGRHPRRLRRPARRHPAADRPRAGRRARAGGQHRRQGLPRAGDRRRDHHRGSPRHVRRSAAASGDVARRPPRRTSPPPAASTSPSPRRSASSSRAGSRTLWTTRADCPQPLSGCDRRSRRLGGRMTTTDDHPILAKVRKLLALAEDPAATGPRGRDLHRQGRSADRRLRHRPGAAGRGRARLRPGRRPRPRPRRAVRRRQGRPARRRSPRACGVAPSPGPAARPSGKERSMHLFGHASDLERTELLYTSLLLQSADRGWPATPVAAGGEHARRLPPLVARRLPDGDRPPARRAPRPRRRPRRATGSRPPAGRDQPRARRPVGAGGGRPMHAAYPAAHATGHGRGRSSGSGARRRLGRRAARRPRRAARSSERRRPATCTGDGPSAGLLGATRSRRPW